MNGWIALPPPISTRHDRAEAAARRTPPCSGRRGRCAGGSSRRSWPTSGAPMIETTATTSSSARASGSRRRDDRALAIEPAHVEEPVIGAAAAAGSEDPGADGERLDLLGGDRAERAGAQLMSPAHQTNAERWDCRGPWRLPHSARVIRRRRHGEAGLRPARPHSPSISPRTRATRRLATTRGTPSASCSSRRAERRKPMQSSSTSPTPASRKTPAAPGSGP